MGEEYGETAPFQYFVSHLNPSLIKAVQEGRKNEFSFVSQENIPDPQSEHTFLNSKLNHQLKNDEQHQELWMFYKKLIGLRKTKPALCTLSKQHMDVRLINEQLLFITREKGRQKILLIANFSNHSREYMPYFGCGKWTLILNSFEQEFNIDEIPPFGILIFQKGNTDE
jgi:maltooligosyltrehalose trehalohydrolase